VADYVLDPRTSLRPRVANENILITNKNIMKTTTSIKALFGAAAMAVVAAQSATAQFANGDLIMSFQATGGTGANQTLVANLGAGYSFRDLNSNLPNVINIGSLLSNTYGANWFNRADVFYSIIGNYDAGASPANPGGLGAPVVNGDARNTIYTGRSKTDNDPTTYNAYSFGASTLGGVGTQVQTYNATVATALASTPAATIPTSVNSTIEDFTTPAGNLLVNFTAYPANFNQSFSDDVLFTINGIEYQGGMTLQRQNRTDSTSGALSNNIVIPGISAGTGSNEGMFAIRDSGQVDYIAAIPEPQTYALLAMAAAGLGAHVIRRRRR